MIPFGLQEKIDSAIPELQCDLRAQLNSGRSPTNQAGRSARLLVFLPRVLCKSTDSRFHFPTACCAADSLDGSQAERTQSRLHPTAARCLDAPCRRFPSCLKQESLEQKKKQAEAVAERLQCSFATLLALLIAQMYNLGKLLYLFALYKKVLASTVLEM